MCRCVHVLCMDRHSVHKHTVHAHMCVCVQVHLCAHMLCESVFTHALCEYTHMCRCSTPCEYSHEGAGMMYTLRVYAHMCRCVCMYSHKCREHRSSMECIPKRAGMYMLCILTSVQVFRPPLTLPQSIQVLPIDFQFTRGPLTLPGDSELNELDPNGVL